jgi:hypothetical protein
MASYANSITASLCCNYFEEDGMKWQLQMRPTFLDISCPMRHLRISMAVNKSKEEKEITYDETDPEYKCGAVVTEAYIESDTCKLTIGVRQHLDDDDEDEDEYGPVESAYAELEGHGCMMKHFMPVKVARILMAIAKNTSVEELKGLEAQHISFLS